MPKILLFLVSITTMEGRREDIVKIRRIFPEKKCRKHLKIVHQLFNHGRDKKAQAHLLYNLLESGYRSAMVGFLLSGDHRNYKKQYRNEALNFAKTALKFEKILTKEFVDPAKLKRTIEELEKPLIQVSYII